MFQVNEDKSIYVTRGDTVYLSVTVDNNGEEYEFQPGDLLRIKVYGKKNCDNVVLQKDFPITEATNSVEIYLDENDTKIGEVISKPVDYWYEIELNPLSDPQTVVGYDEDGAKVFKLFPEGADIEVYIPTEEDIPFVDDELDLTSLRPVQNQAIARAVERLKGAIRNSESAIAVEKARISNIVASQTVDSELIDIRVGANGKIYDCAGDAVRDQYKSMCRMVSPIINQDNVFNDPTITSIGFGPEKYTEDTGWCAGNIEATIGIGTKYANAIVFNNSTNIMPYIYQDMAATKVKQGNYIFSCKCKSSTSISRAHLQVTGYALESNSGGVSLGASYIDIAASDEFEIYSAAVSVADTSSYNHLRIFLTLPNATVIELTEIIMVEEGQHTEFSPIAADIEKNPLLGKKLCVNGDSICYGEGYEGGYAKIIAERNNMTYQNIAVSGATIASNTYYSDGTTKRHWISATMSDLDSDGDYYIIEGGFNDAGNNVNPNANAFSDAVSTTKPTDLTNMLNAMESICYDLIVNHAGKKIGFVFPHKIGKNEWTVQGNNTHSYTWGMYKELQKKVLKKWGVPFIDLAECTGMNTFFSSIASVYTNNNDAVHPNKLGYETYYIPKIEAWLKTL